MVQGCVVTVSPCGSVMLGEPADGDLVLAMVDVDARGVVDVMPLLADPAGQ